MEEIKNYDKYVSGMKKSCSDKLFFLDKVDGMNGVVDYGCADGVLLGEINKISNLKLIGYDINPEMVLRAKNNIPNSIITTDYREALQNADLSNSVLNLSSVIHEIYSYSMEYAIDEFWKDIFEPGFKYISIRDFCVSGSINRKTDVNDYVKIIQKADKQQISDYESIWGSLRENRNMVHFLMKYRYRENWDREVRENYFPITLEKILSKIPTNLYEIVYFEDYKLPYTANKVKEDFGIEIHDNTHVKILLKRKGESKRAA